MAATGDSTDEKLGAGGVVGGGACAAAALADEGGTVNDVLVVEDDPEINELIGAYAQLAGFGYRAAHSGGTALNEVRRRAPSVIVLDVMLPDLDGFEVCRLVKTGPDACSVPVIMLTALDGEKPRSMGRQCGAVEFITKPFDPERLMESITRHSNYASLVAAEGEKPR